MSGKRRIVPVLVDDDAVANLIVTFVGPAVDQQAVWRGDVEQLGGMIVPVPPDDQLTRDVDAVTRYFLGRVPTEPNDAAMRLRTEFGLDEGSE